MTVENAFFIFGLTLPKAYCRIVIDMHDEAGLTGEDEGAASLRKARNLKVFKESELTVALVNTGSVMSIAKARIRSLLNGADGVSWVFSVPAHF